VLAMLSENEGRVPAFSESKLADTTGRVMAGFVDPAVSVGIHSLSDPETAKELATVCQCSPGH